MNARIPDRLPTTQIERGQWRLRLDEGGWIECESEDDAQEMATAPILKWRADRGELDSVLGIAELCCLAALFRGYGLDGQADCFEALARLAGDRMAAKLLSHRGPAAPHTRPEGQPANAGQAVSGAAGARNQVR